MRIYILRHGIAEDATPRAPDSGRALTGAGKLKLCLVMERARQCNVAPSLILTSPYKRALDTAAIAAEILPCKREPVRTNALLPSGSPERVWKEMLGAGEPDLMLVGHEPLLSGIAAFLLGCPELVIDLKKGAMIRIDVEDPEAEPHGTLKWLLTPKLASGVA